MLPSDQDLLLRAVENHYSSDHNTLVHFLTNYNTFQQQKLQEGVETLFQYSTIQIRSQASSNKLYFSEKRPDSRFTLLIILSYKRTISPPLALLPLLASLHASEIYKTLNKTDSITIKWLLYDLDDPTSIHMLDEENPDLQADAVLWYAPEPDLHSTIPQPLLALGTKGHLSLEICIQTASQPLPTSYGNILPNAAWRLLWALGALKNAQEDILIDGFYDTIAAPSDEALTALSVLPAHFAVLPPEWGLQQWLLGLHDNQLHYTHFLTPSCTITYLTSALSMRDQQRPSDPSESSIPTYASALIDFFLVPNQEPTDIFAKIQAHLQQENFADLQIKLLTARAPLQIDLHTPFAQAAIRATIAVYGASAPIIPLTASSLPLSLIQLPQAIVVTPELTLTDHIVTNSLSQSTTNVANTLLTAYTKQLVLLFQEILNHDSIKQIEAS